MDYNSQSSEKITKYLQTRYYFASLVLHLKSITNGGFEELFAFCRHQLYTPSGTLAVAVRKHLHLWFVYQITVVLWTGEYRRTTALRDCGTSVCQMTTFRSCSLTPVQLLEKRCSQYLIVANNAIYQDYEVLKLWRHILLYVWPKWYLQK